MAREVQQHNHPISLAAFALLESDASNGNIDHNGDVDADVDWHYDILLHAGDLAYDLHQDAGSVGDAFMRDVQPIASTTPFMVSPGNHEAFANFSHFKNRFTMPLLKEDAAAAENLWWSVDVGMVHVVSYNTEAYFDGDVNATVEAQYNWLKADLAAAQANRDAVPWIIAMGHRPFYCNVAAHNTTTGAYMCDGEQEQSRLGPPSQARKYVVLMTHPLRDFFYGVN